MTKLRAFFLPTLVGFALSISSVAQADLLIYDNLGAVSDGADNVSASGPGLGAFGPLADSFSTGPAASLLNVQLLLGTLGNTGTTSVDLYSDNSISPGTFLQNLGTIAESSLSTYPSLAVVDVSGFTPYALAAGTRYWIELSTADGSSAQWSWSLDTSGTGVGSEYYSNANGVFPNSNGPYQMQVTVSGIAVPEPSTVPLVILGIGAFAILRRRVIR